MKTLIVFVKYICELTSNNEILLFFPFWQQPKEGETMVAIYIPAPVAAMLAHKCTYIEYMGSINAWQQCWLPDV
jgi:hypothetical protein